MFFCTLKMDILTGWENEGEKSEGKIGPREGTHLERAVVSSAYLRGWERDLG